MDIEQHLEQIRLSMHNHDYKRGLRDGLDLALRIARDTGCWPAEYAKDSIQDARNELCRPKRQTTAA